MEKLKIIIIGVFIAFLAIIVTVGILDMAFIAKPYSDTFIVADKYIDHIRQETSTKDVRYKEVNYMVFRNDRLTFKESVSLHYFYKYNVNDTVFLYNMKKGIFIYTSSFRIKEQ